MSYDGLTRRDALARGFGGVFLVCSFPTDARKRALGRRTSAGARAAAAAPFEPFQRDLPLPPVARPVSRTRAKERYVITMKPGTADILPGYKTPILGYDGLYPGPTIKATRGRTVEILQRNASGRSLNVHLHGGITPADSDGHPHDAIPDGAERLYTYPNQQRAATLFYHDHAHGETAKTLNAGLAGFYLIADTAEDELELPRGDYDIPLVIQDRSFNADGSFRYRLDLDRGFRGDTILVNGAIAPRLKVERRLYRLRFNNGSNGRAYALALGNNRAMTQIASDTALLPKPVRRRVIPLEPGERVDVVVDFRDFGIGSKVILHNTAGEATTKAVMRFDVVRGRDEEARVPRRLSELEDLPPVNAQRAWPLTFQGLGASMWQIGGGGFDDQRIDARPRLGTTELWGFTNHSQRTHPMHIHGYHFRVVSINGRPPHPGDRGWKDTVAVLPNHTVVVRPYFDYFGGRYVFHCHALEHGDMSMMGQMVVVE
jgi:FtsP/CotA-like multicopper oxidase with cupredoxin domain